MQPNNPTAQSGGTSGRALAARHRPSLTLTDDQLDALLRASRAWRITVGELCSVLSLFWLSWLEEDDEHGVLALRRANALRDGTDFPEWDDLETSNL